MIPGHVFIALMDARKKQKSGGTLTPEEQALIDQYPEREPDRCDNCGRPFEPLEVRYRLGS